MAALEKKRLILRVAYAGPPLAGKTESIRALLRLLRGKGGDKYVFSPGEARGRTIFFDWADYEAGTFQGNPIRCQITSVPGQSVLSSRREALLKAADAVILVVDSRPEGLEETRRCYQEMAPWLKEAGRDAEIRVILQCNKQDLDGSLSPQVLSERLELPFGSRLYATSARTGKGLRPAFIAAVREALERAQSLIESGLIRFGQPDISTGQELLERLQRDAVAADAAVEPEERAPVVVALPPVPREIAPAPPPPAPREIALAPHPPTPRAIAPASPPPIAHDVSTADRAEPAPKPSDSAVVALKPRRPAVMPASAWRKTPPHSAPNHLPKESQFLPPGDVSTAALKIEPVKKAEPPAPALIVPAPIETKPRIDRRARPAVMPITAYRESTTARLREVQRQTGWAIAPDIAEPEPPKAPGLVPPAPERPKMPSEPATMKPELTTVAERPAVMPAAAFRARFGGDFKRKSSTLSNVASDKAANVEPLTEAPRLPGRGLTGEQVCPLSIWQALEPQMSFVVRALHDPRGGWHGEPLAAWYAHTMESAADFSEARRLYDTAVSRHSVLHRYLSKERCLALTQENDRWWIWQMVGKVSTLAARLDDWPRPGDSPEATAEALADVAAGYWNALEAIGHAPEALPLGLDEIAQQDGGFVYAGLLPRDPAPPAAIHSDLGTALEEKLRKKLSPASSGNFMDVPAVLTELQRKAAGRLPGSLLEMLCSVLIGH